MSEYPILFNAEMVNAILEDRKTQTRRLKAPWKVGELLYVKETHTYLFKLDENDKPIEGTGKCYYRADGHNPTPFNQFINPKTGEINLDKDCPYWTPSIFMPKRLTRLWLRVTTMRTERLQNITFNDAYDEGVNPPLVAGLDVDINGEYWQHGVRTVIKAFADLWDRCAKPGFKWADNPEVIVTEFERIDHD